MGLKNPLNELKRWLFLLLLTVIGKNLLCLDDVESSSYRYLFRRNILRADSWQAVDFSLDPIRAFGPWDILNHPHERVGVPSLPSLRIISSGCLSPTSGAGA